MKTKTIFCLLLILLGVDLANAQTKKTEKSNLYVYFEPSLGYSFEMKMLKLKRPLSSHDIYVFECKNIHQAIYNSIDKNIFTLIDSSAFKALELRPPAFLCDVNNYSPDVNGIRSKKYKQVFIVEKISDNQFKIIEIVCYIGDIFFAPQRRKNPDEN